MTVSTTTTKNSAAGNGSTTAFTYSFVITAASELKVYIRTDSTGAETLKTDGTHYNVAGVGAASGGTVTFTSGNIPASGETVVLLRDTPLTQATDYVENDPFPAAAHEDALDKLTHQVQELQEEVDRSLKASKTVTDLTTPEFKDPAATRAGKFLAFDGDGDELTVTDGPLADAVVSSPADAHVLLYDGTDTRWENKAVSGDIAITSAGVTSIASGVIVNADVNASAAIADSKLATISTADKVSGAAIQVDGATDGTSITIADTDKFLIDDGGTTKYVNASQVNSYTSASVAADDIGTGDAAASFQTSSGAVVVDSQASTTTIDGHTGVTVQSSNSGDILLDSAADVVLDAAGNDITLKAAGTTFGSLTNSSSDLVIESKVADKDILFKGTDDSSAVTALSLDMSEGGKATFAGDVVVTGDLTISGDDLVMGTNTSGAALIGDGTNYNPVVISGDIAIGTDGTAAIGSGVIVNSDINGSAAIADSKLDTISTANKVGLAALDIDGGTELGEAIVDADLFIIDNGAGGTNRKVLASRIKTYASGSGVSLSNDGNNRIVTADGSGGLNGESALIFDGSLMFLNDDANGGMTDGFTINQGGADDEALALKSSDVSHGATDFGETDTYALFQKVSSTDGGLMVRGFSDGAVGMELRAMNTTNDTSDSSGSVGTMTLRSSIKTSGNTNDTNVGATGNLIVFRDLTSTRVVIKGDGTVHAQDTSWATALDTENDMLALRMLDKAQSTKGVIDSAWDSMIGTDWKYLQKIGVAGSDHPEKGHPDMFSIQGVQKLTMGATWYLGQNFMAFLETVEKRLPGIRKEFETHMLAQSGRPAMLTQEN